MADTNEPPVLADMMALKIGGPALVFLRPRHPVPQDMSRSLAEAFGRARDSGEFVDLAHVKLVIIPHDFDVMVMGDVELERAGLTRLAAETA